MIKGVLFLLTVIMIDRMESNEELTSIVGSENKGRANLMGAFEFRIKEDGMEVRWVKEIEFLR